MLNVIQITQKERNIYLWVFKIIIELVWNTVLEVPHNLTEPHAYNAYIILSSHESFKRINFLFITLN